jgi:hypothetical protein
MDVKRVSSRRDYGLPVTHSSQHNAIVWRCVDLCEIIYKTVQTTTRNYALTNTVLVLEFGANAIVLPFYQERVSFCLLFGDQWHEAGLRLC